MKKIAILTSGGDSPGMNATIRAVVRTALSKDLEVIGVQKGYTGLLNEYFHPLNLSSVGNILQRGGTILQTSRCKEFHQSHYRQKIHKILRTHDIDALIVLGGNGSFNGAYKLSLEHSYPVIGIPCTIDNDIMGTEYSIGFDSAVQTAVEAVDKIRDTASALERTFIIEVMGRNSTSIATHTGISTGAEDIIDSQQKPNYEQIASNIKRGIERGKTASILIVAEREKPGYSYEIQQTLKEQFHISSHVCILGHIQRGGTPTARDRFIASHMGFYAVLGLINKKYCHATSFAQGKVILNPLAQSLQKKDNYIDQYVELARTLSL